jgi:hypothetical protein
MSHESKGFLMQGIISYLSKIVFSGQHMTEYIMELRGNVMLIVIPAEVEI